MGDNCCKMNRVSRIGRVSQPVLPMLPAQARSVGPSAGLLEGPDGGVVFVFGLATFTYASGDQAGRRLAAVQLVATKAASVAEVAPALNPARGSVADAFGTASVLRAGDEILAQVRAERDEWGER